MFLKHGGKKFRRALVGIRGRNQVGFQRVVLRNIFIVGARRVRQSSQLVGYGVLNLLKEDLPKTQEVNSSDFHVIVVSGVKTPLKMQRNAISFVPRQFFKGIPQRLKLR